MRSRTKSFPRFGRRPWELLLGAASLFLFWVPLSAQTVRPLIDENSVKAPGDKATGKIEYVNDSLDSLTVMMDIKSYTVSDLGALSYRPLDRDISRVTLFFMRLLPTSCLPGSWFTPHSQDSKRARKMASRSKSNCPIQSICCRSSRCRRTISPSNWLNIIPTQERSLSASKILALNLAVCSKRMPLPAEQRLRKGASLFFRTVSGRSRSPGTQMTSQPSCSSVWNVLSWSRA